VPGHQTMAMARQRGSGERYLQALREAKSATVCATSYGCASRRSGIVRISA
jgi:hypothetical protein